MPAPSTPHPENPDPDSGMLPVLFANLVVQQSNFALMLLGQLPDPQSGKTTLDLDGARLFIDQLGMLEHKTRGNLTDPEQRLLKDSLTHLRLTFAEAVNRAREAKAASPESPAAQSSPPASPAPEDAEGRKRFTKSY